ncbi:MAG: DUF1329 domain-containing protein [Pseudomonadales bacterium]|nr:DUF1329 domain-containing protein [Pseudomonadales bacterium]
MQNRIKAALLVGSIAASGALAAVSPEQAAELGKTLTPMGAEMAGNADGSIPAWDGAGAPIPPGYVEGSSNYIDPFPNEKPTLIINASNWQQYADNLTEGTKAMFEKYGADGWELQVYPTHRTSTRPDWYYANTAKNATGANLVADGQKIEGNYPGVPFPMPQSGLEAIWNHMVRYGADINQNYDVYLRRLQRQRRSGNQCPLSIRLPHVRKTPDQVVGDTPYTLLRIDYNAPARRAGEILLVHEPGADYTEGKGREAWQYLVGQRRVRMAPAVSFDTPNPGVAGTTTYDDSFVYNGSPERFNWKLVGKKEMYVPANNNRFVFETDVTDALGEKFFKPEFIRWEKRRVWIVDSTLKEGQRHLYSRRTFYLDEDTWTAVAGDMYDGRGNLWRLQYVYPAVMTGNNSDFFSAYGAYDLLQNIYNINSKPIPGKFKQGTGVKDDKFFTPKGMARSGVR